MDFFGTFFDKDFTYNNYIDILEELGKLDEPYLPLLSQSKMPFFHMIFDYDMESVKQDILEIYNTATKEQKQPKKNRSGEKDWYIIKLKNPIPKNLETFLTKFTVTNDTTWISVVKGNGGFIGAHMDPIHTHEPLHKQRFGVQYPKECKLVTADGSTNLQDRCTFFNTYRRHGVYNKSSFDKIDITFWFDYSKNKSLIESSTKQSIENILENIG
jgi:hypothetical protein